MIGAIIGLFIIFIVLGLLFKITGFLLKACIWLFVLLPLACLLWGVGLILCCTLLLIPVGICLFKAGARVLVL